MRIDENMDPALRDGWAFATELGFAPEEMTAEKLPAIRERLNELFSLARTEMPENKNVIQEDHFVPGPAGSPDVRVRVYRPAHQRAGLACLYWIHGGGMVLGDVEMDDFICDAFVERVGCVVVSVDYRVAPEDPHPAPVEDCYAGLCWTAEAADELGIDPDRIAVGGASAGGGLAAGTVLLARDRGNPRVAFQLLIYPMLDDRDATASAREFTGIACWSREHNRAGWRALLGDLAGSADVDPYAAPARADDLSNLPSALIQVGELEVFRDESITYASRLLESGVSVELHVYPGAFHGWDRGAPTADISVRMRDEQIRALRDALRVASNVSAER
jgi:acetyl esterase/lipase